MGFFIFLFRFLLNSVHKTIVAIFWFLLCSIGLGLFAYLVICLMEANPVLELYFGKAFWQKGPYEHWLNMDVAVNLVAVWIFLGTITAARTLIACLHFSLHTIFSDISCIATIKNAPYVIKAARAASKKLGFSVTPIVFLTDRGLQENTAGASYLFFFIPFIRIRPELACARNDDLAAIMAHEMSHIKRFHGAKRAILHYNLRCLYSFVFALGVKMFLYQKIGLPGRVSILLAIGICLVPTVIRARNILVLATIGFLRRAFELQAEMDMARAVGTEAALKKYGVSIERAHDDIEVLGCYDRWSDGPFIDLAYIYQFVKGEALFDSFNEHLRNAGRLFHPYHPAPKVCRRILKLGRRQAKQQTKQRALRGQAA